MNKIIAFCKTEILIDSEDFNFLNQYKWSLKKDCKTSYAQTWIKENNKWKRIVMHRLLLNPPPKIKVDHINRNGLDNRRSNLRLVTNSESAINRSTFKNNKVGHKGIHKSKNKYVARIQINNKRIMLGSFENLDDAIKAYKDASEVLGTRVYLEDYE